MIEIGLTIEDEYVRTYLWERGLIAIDENPKLREHIKQRTWVGLTDDEVFELFCVEGTADADINPIKLLADARRLEAKLKEKNNG